MNYAIPWCGCCGCDWMSKDMDSEVFAETVTAYYGTFPTTFSCASTQDTDEGNDVPSRKIDYQFSTDASHRGIMWNFLLFNKAYDPSAKPALTQFELSVDAKMDPASTNKYNGTDYTPEDSSHVTIPLYLALKQGGKYYVVSGLNIVGFTYKTSWQSYLRPMNPYDFHEVYSGLLADPNVGINSGSSPDFTSSEDPIYMGIASALSMGANTAIGEIMFYLDNLCINIMHS